MIPPDIRLYTWVDVEEVLLRIQEQGSLPEWLIWVRAYWDSLTIGICPGTQAEAKDWLREVYDPRFRIDSEDNMVNGLILLGLGFSLTATGRPAVMSLARRAAKQGT